MQLIQNITTFVLVLITLMITSYQDIKNMDNVSWWIFLPLPIIRIVFLFLNPNMTSVWNPIMDTLAGGAIGALFLIFSLVGLCGGADIIMITCIGCCIGFLDIMHSLLYASVVMLICECVRAIKNQSFKELKHKNVPYIPYYSIGFIATFIINHFIGG